MVIHKPDHVEPVGSDARVREVFPDDGTVC
jgi:hypothetical protein